VLKGAVAGAIGGLIGGVAMLAFGSAFDCMFDQSASHRGRPRKFLPTADQELDGTAALALAAGRAVGHDLKGASLVNTARVMHFAFSAGLGAIYGALAELTPRTTVACGMAFAAAEELSGNELLMPRIGFLRKDYPVHERVHSLASHLLWGVMTERVRHQLRSEAA
jgi:uncharacterized membrane protein YagU involved in acid resistance